MRKLILLFVISLLTFNVAFSQTDNDGDGYDETVDCNDWDPSVNPGMLEDYCNQDGIDNDCNGAIDENYDAYLCNGGAYDNDGDGYNETDDCNDWDATVNPGMYEDQCNNDGIDNNCNGQVDENYDLYLCGGGGGPYDNDGDGYDETVDCNDWDPSVNPGMLEDYCNQDGIDNDCNGAIDENYDAYLCNGGAYDNDGDGYNETEDCNDWDASVNPGMCEDQCNNDGIDNNCDGQVDENYNYNACFGIYDNDGDGYDNLSDCDDANSQSYPGAPELCDQLDNDCDAYADEDLITTVYYIDNDGDGYGNGSAGDFCADPGMGYSLSNDDCNDDDPAIHPDAVEIINNAVDEDCDGSDQLVGLTEDPDAVVTLYPNPGNDQLTVNVSPQEEETWKVAFIDNQGNIVLSEDLQSTSDGKIDVNTAACAKGSYQLILSNSKRFIRTSWVKI